MDFYLTNMCQYFSVFSNQLEGSLLGNLLQTCLQVVLRLYFVFNSVVAV